MLRRASPAASLTSVRVGVSVETKTQNAHSLFEGCVFFSRGPRAGPVIHRVVGGKRLNSTFRAQKKNPCRPPCPVYGSSWSGQIRRSLRHVRDKVLAADFPRDLTRVESGTSVPIPTARSLGFPAFWPCCFLPIIHLQGCYVTPPPPPLSAPQRSRLNAL